MSGPLIAVVVVVSLAILFGAVFGTRTYLRYRGKMLVTCPETGKPAAVDVNAGRAARTSLLGTEKLRLHDCTRWPERKNCGQECLSEVEADPSNCLVWTKVAEWYAGRECIYCNKPFEEIRWHDRRPAVHRPDGTTIQWNELSAEQLPEVFETHLPVCWSCHVAESMRHEHPELVIDRERKPSPP